MRQLAPLLGVSKSAADPVIDHIGPRLTLQTRKRFAKDTVPIVDDTLIPPWDHTTVEWSKNYRCSTNRQIVIGTEARLVVVVGWPLAGNRNDCKAREESGTQASLCKTPMITDGASPETGVVITYHRERGQAELPNWKGGTEQVEQAGPRPRRARLRPYEDLEDPPRLPPKEKESTTSCSASPGFTNSRSPDRSASSTVADHT
ncbi:hypothetical protein Nans01_00030 [Nocardiopsis ansamitocini]|uniref:Transposase n=1 Tax=Nocardiopsis ansamitocini TaxID=1670832 RepID=A0A9W6P201_9ACTN|nr:hypothetical protein Nans01_00030 [Nocardiopsis ansamitocini]